MKNNNVTYDLFELLYLYVENIRCFESQEFKFTTEYKIEYNPEERSLSITENHDKDHLKGFFGPNISNINVIVGKNGSGKTTVLDLIGNNDIDIEQIINEDSGKNKYFIIFKTNNNNIYIEGFNYCIDKIIYFEHLKNETIIDMSDVRLNKNYYNFILDTYNKKKIHVNSNPLDIGRKLFYNNEQECISNYNKTNSIILSNRDYNKINFTKSINRLNRSYFPLFVNKSYYASLYKTLTSDYEFTKLLNTNVCLIFENNFRFFEEHVIFNHIINIIQKIDSNPNFNSNQHFAIHLTSSFIIKSNQFFLNKSSLIYDKTKSITELLDYLLLEFSIFQEKQDEFYYNNEIITPFEKISNFQYNNNDIRKMKESIEAIKSRLNGSIFIYNNPLLEIVNELEKIKNELVEIENNLVLCFSINKMLYNNKNYIKNICLQLRNNIDDIIIDLINLNIIIENLVITRVLQLLC